MSLAFRASRRTLGTCAVLLAAALAGCTGDDATAPGPMAFNQVQRLGNPLVSEVLLEKRDHALHGATAPVDDPQNIAGKIRTFIATVGGRSATVQNGVVSVLVPDVLVVQSDRDPATAGWLSWALVNGWGGRRLQDDVVDTALLAVFGPVFESAGVTPGLTTDNVSSDSPFTTTFPYLAPPN